MITTQYTIILPTILSQKFVVTIPNWGLTVCGAGDVTSVHFSVGFSMTIQILGYLGTIYKHLMKGEFSQRGMESNRHHQTSDPPSQAVVGFGLRQLATQVTAFPWGEGDNGTYNLSYNPNEYRASTNKAWQREQEDTTQRRMVDSTQTTPALRFIAIKASKRSNLDCCIFELATL
jgi:hypothetical protein